MHQRTLQKRCSHMTNTERSKALYLHHSCIVIRKSTENGYLTAAHHTTGVSTCPTLRGEKHFPSTSCFIFMLGVYTSSTYFYYTKAILMRRKYRNNSQTTSAFGLLSTIQERWIIEEKWSFAKGIRHLKRSNKKVGWRCASYKESIQVVSQHGIKGPDAMASLVWANTNISGYVMHNSISIVICST